MTMHLSCPLCGMSEQFTNAEVAAFVWKAAAEIVALRSQLDQTREALRRWSAIHPQSCDGANEIGVPCTCGVAELAAIRRSLLGEPKPWKPPPPDNDIIGVINDGYKPPKNKPMTDTQRIPADGQREA